MPAPSGSVFARVRPPRKGRKGEGNTSRKAEHMEGSSFRGRVLQVAHGVDEAERRGAVADVEVAGDDRTRPAADAGQDGDVLLAVRPAIGRRLADDPGAGLELPQRLAGAGVDRLEPALHGSVEDDVAGGGERAAPDREVLGQRPRRLRLPHVPGLEYAAMAAGPGLEAHLGADIGRAGDVVRGRVLEVHAEIGVWDVEE